MIVKNLEGTSKCKPSKISWLDVWAKINGRPNDRTIPCYNNDCPNGDLADNGGHVCLESDDGFCYIVPLCDTCNSHTNTDIYDVNREAIIRIRPLEQSENQKDGVCAYRAKGICRLSEFM